MVASVLQGLSPAEAGLIVDHQAGTDEAYATFADLIVKSRVLVVGSPPARTFSWNGVAEGLEPHEALVLKAVFKSPRVGESEASRHINGIRPLQFAASVADGCRADGVYAFEPREVFFWNIAKTRLTWGTAFFSALYFLAPVLSFLLAGLAVVLALLAGRASEPALALVSALAVILWAPAFVLSVAASVFYLSRKGVISVGLNEPSLKYRLVFVVLGVVLWLFVAVLSVFLFGWYVFLRLRGAGLPENLDARLTPQGKTKRGRYLALKELLKKHGLAESRLANEYEPYRIAFGLVRNRRKIPA